MCQKELGLAQAWQTCCIKPKLMLGGEHCYPTTEEKDEATTACIIHVNVMYHLM